MEENLICIIIPVYNVEHYIRRCLDSLINQTYGNLEILIVDDGSTDESGRICDEYEKLDERVRVFHTENRGLSCARNLGLDEASGNWIGFVDSDDWIEQDMYECLIQRAEETGADVVECGRFEEYPSEILEYNCNAFCISGKEAAQGILHDLLYENVWNKLWKRKCFENIRFPKGRLHEDVATTHRALEKANMVCSISDVKYHYYRRKGSISDSHDIKNLIDYWLSQKDRYNDLWISADETGKQNLLKKCAAATARTWAYYNGCPVTEREKYREEIQDMNSFMKQSIPLFGQRDWNTALRVGSFFPHFCNSVSFQIAWMVNRRWKRNRK